MTIDKTTIDIPKLVAEIKRAERSGGEKSWHHFIIVERHRHDWWEHYVTGLCILRAHLRGKLHRQNPPASLRDYNRSQGRAIDHGWDAALWNAQLAEKVAAGFLREEPVDAQDARAESSTLHASTSARTA